MTELDRCREDPGSAMRKKGCLPVRIVMSWVVEVSPSRSDTNRVPPDPTVIPNCMGSEQLNRMVELIICSAPPRATVMFSSKVEVVLLMTI